MNEWKPDWILPPEPLGDDEEEVKKLFYSEKPLLKWDELQEWQRESWRREYRDKP